MKYIIIIGDGCADLPIDELGGKTPLEYANTPNMDRLCALGEIGRAKTVPNGVPAGSDTAILSIFGYDPRKYYTGRSPLEAAGSGMELFDGEISFRTNVVALSDAPVFEDKIIFSHSGGNVEGDESIALMEALLADEKFSELMKPLSMRFKLNPSFRHVSAISGIDKIEYQTPPHDIVNRRIGDYLPNDEVSLMLRALMKRAYEVMNDHPVNIRRREKGLLAANSLWFWGEGKAITLPNFVEKLGKTCKAITAVPLVSGIAALGGLSSVEVEGATGDIDTNYEGKAKAALKVLEEGTDMVVIHIEAPDECSHAGDMEGKIKAIENIDKYIVGPAAQGVKDDLRLLYLSDHPTLLSTRTHDGAPVPFFIYDSRVLQGCGKTFGETNADKGVYIEEGSTLIERLLEK